MQDSPAITSPRTRPLAAPRTRRPLAAPRTRRPLAAPRARRTAAAVIAQYIQDLSRPSEPVPCGA
jgi:hypothetical protein